MSKQNNKDKMTCCVKLIIFQYICDTEFTCMTEGQHDQKNVESLEC